MERNEGVRRIASKVREGGKEGGSAKGREGKRRERTPSQRLWMRENANKALHLAPGSLACTTDLQGLSHTVHQRDERRLCTEEKSGLTRQSHHTEGNCQGVSKRVCRHSKPEGKKPGLSREWL